jgi:hypothetical protein
MDEFFGVNDLVPFLEYENYPLITATEHKPIAVDARGLIAFRTPESSIFCGDVSETIQYIDDHTDSIADYPHLKSQLQRIEASSLTPSYQTWREVADASFSREEQRRYWVNSEVALFQSQRRIWDDIESNAQTNKTESNAGFKGNIAEYDSEYLIRWLTNKKTFGFNDWIKVWHYVNEVNPFDQRLLDTAEAWLIFNQTEGGDLGDARTLLYAIFHHARFSAKEFENLGVFLSEELASKPFFVFGFIRPQNLFKNLIWFLSKFGNIDDTFSILMFAITELPREPYIGQALRDGIDILARRAVDDDHAEALTKTMLQRIQERDAADL